MGEKGTYKSKNAETVASLAGRGKIKQHDTVLQPNSLGRAREISVSRREGKELWVYLGKKRLTTILRVGLREGGKYSRQEFKRSISA